MCHNALESPHICFKICVWDSWRRGSLLWGQQGWQYFHRLLPDCLPRSQGRTRESRAGPGCHRPLKGAHGSPTAAISSRVTLERTRGRCSSDFLSFRDRHSGGRKHRGKASGTSYWVTHPYFKLGRDLHGGTMVPEKTKRKPMLRVVSELEIMSMYLVRCWVAQGG